MLNFQCIQSACGIVILKSCVCFFAQICVPYSVHLNIANVNFEVVYKTMKHLFTSDLYGLLLLTSLIVSEWFSIMFTVYVIDVWYRHRWGGSGLYTPKKHFFYYDNTKIVFNYRYVCVCCKMS